jgi:gliding motility-associated-like protein
VSVANATRPSVQASNLTVSQITCNSVQLNFTAGDGNARIIVGTEGNIAPNFVPSDDNAYTPVPYFNLKGFSATTYGSPANCYIVYNANGTNYVRIDSLKPCTKYTFQIYEHDNNGNQTLYNFTSPPTVTFETYCLKLNFTTLFKDSCEAHNSYEFTNNSTSTIPGVSYTYDFNDASGLAAATLGSPVTHSYKNRSGVVLVKLSASPNYGCLADYYDKVRIYPKRVAFIDHTKFIDSVQCLETNYFVVDPKPVASPLPKSFTYQWFFGDSSAIDILRTMKHTYKKSGKYKVMLELLTNVNQKPTSCKDTLRFGVEVLPSPVGQITIGPDTSKRSQCLKNNQFVFNNPDNNLSYFKWYFGDNDSSDLKSVAHSYKNIGTYRVVHIAFAINGCKGRDTNFVSILPDISANFKGLSPEYCQSNQLVTLIPDSLGGLFSGGLPVATPAYTFTPNTVGTYNLKYVFRNKFCADSTEQTYKVNPTPKPAIGPDIVKCLTGAINLDANYTIGSYQWNTGATTQGISVSKSGDYSVKVTEGNCEASDTVSVIFSVAPQFELGKDTSVCKGNGLILRATSPGGTSYLWQDGTTDSIYYVYNSGKYAVKATNACGSYEDSVFIFFQNDYCDLFMATAFSPDNDLLNAVFKPEGKNMTVKLFQIYNRWGEIVFETDKDNVGWDGQYKNKPCEQDLFLWKLFYTTPNGRYIKKSNASGTVLLLR